MTSSLLPSDVESWSVSLGPSKHFLQIGSRMQSMEQPAPAGFGGGSTLLIDSSQSVACASRQSSTRACTMCVKAKAKCMPHAGIEGVCQRCHRLRKECFFYERPKRKRTRTSKPTRVAQLEEKLDSLVTLLTSNQPAIQANPITQASVVLIPRSPVSLSSNASTAGPSTTTPPPINLDGGTTALETGGRDIVPADPRRGSAAENSPIEPDEQEAEIMLLEFKTTMADQFPFVVIHPKSTSQSLYHEKPLLWKAIMVAASHANSDHQLALGAGLMDDLTTRLLFKAETSLDLLQALLVFIAWYHYHTLVNPQVTNLLHLAKALINSMGLNRAQTAYDRGKLFLDGHDHCTAGTLPSYRSSSTKFDGWRALAGCFYLTTVISASCRALELQFNTHYVLECCQKIEEAGEYQSDVLLVQLVRLQEIRYRMSRSFPYDDSHEARRPDAPVEMFVRVWQKELDTFWASLPVESKQNWLLLATYHTTEIALYEIDWSDYTSYLPRTAVIVDHRTGKLEFMYASLLATRRVFDNYSSVPVERLSGICFTLWVQFNHALLNGFKLLSSEADGWDLQHARSLLTFPDLLHSQIKAMEGVVSRRGLVLKEAMDGKDVFTRIHLKVKHALQWYKSLRASRIEPQGQSDQPADPNGSIGAADPGESLPVFDDAFWQNLLDDNWMLVGDGLSM